MLHSPYFFLSVMLITFFVGSICFVVDRKKESDWALIVVIAMVAIYIFSAIVVPLFKSNAGIVLEVLDDGRVVIESCDHQLIVEDGNIKGVTVGDEVTYYRHRQVGDSSLYVSEVRRSAPETETTD